MSSRRRPRTEAPSPTIIVLGAFLLPDETGFAQSFPSTNFAALSPRTPASEGPGGPADPAQPLYLIQGISRESPRRFPINRSPASSLSCLLRLCTSLRAGTLPGRLRRIPCAKTFVSQPRH